MSRSRSRSPHAEELLWRTDPALAAHMVHGVGEPLTVTVILVSGDSKVVESLNPDSRLSELFNAVAELVGLGDCIHSLDAIGKLALGDQLLEGQSRTLDALGIDGQTPLTFVQTMDLLTIRVSQGDVLQVGRDAACMSSKITAAVEASGPHEEVALPDCKHAPLRKAMEYCAHHWHTPPDEIQKPLRSNNLRECGASEWDCDFIDALGQEDLFDLILVANALDIKPLLDLSCAKVAAMIKGKSTEEIRKQFNIVNDFTPEEEVQVREENRWCEDA